MELLNLAKETRMRAKLEKRPYQIVLDRDGAFAMRYAGPYEERGEIKERFEIATQRSEEELRLYREEGANQPELAVKTIGMFKSKSVIEEEPWVSEPTWLKSYEFPDDVACSVKSWGEAQFKILQGEEMRRWIFQPSGLCDPLTVRMERDGSNFQVTFDPLTADIAKEESFVE